VLRGGSWGSFACYCRAAGRYGSEPGYRYDDLGFRLILEAETELPLSS
jgi:formylglycine-generating enzyme required for sulfatase activity